MSPNAKFSGFFPLNLLKYSLISHLLVEVTVGYNRFCTFYQSFLVVDTIEQDRQFRLEGDKVETFLPVGIR